MMPTTLVKLMQDFNLLLLQTMFLITKRSYHQR